MQLRVQAESRLGEASVSDKLERDSSSRVEKLSKGQLDCLLLVDRHLSSKEISAELGISRHTVDQRIRQETVSPPKLSRLSSTSGAKAKPHTISVSNRSAASRAAAKAWSKWEGEVVTLLPSPKTIERFTDDDFAIAIARIENHYMCNKGWLDEGQLLRGAARLADIPGIIVQGRHDCCTPPRAAWELKKAWPQVELEIVPDGGHSFDEPGVLDGLIRATDRFAV